MLNEPVSIGSRRILVSRIILREPDEMFRGSLIIPGITYHDNVIRYRMGNYMG